MTNLAQRTVSGVIGVSLMLGMILWNKYSFAFLFLFISVAALNEFYSLATDDKIKPQKWMGIVCGILVYLICITLSLGDFGLISRAWTLAVHLLLPLMFLVFISELYRKSSQPFANIGFTILGIVYIPFTMALLLTIASNGITRGYYAYTMVGYLFILWIYDIGAYFGGRWFGKTKLFERISPKKTWEGVAGGTLAAFIMAHFVSMFSVNLSRLDWLIVTAIIIVTSTFGDLVESMFKRSIKIKDSGSAIPGHGGFLDRFDGLFISSPFVFVYLSWMHG